MKRLRVILCVVCSVLFVYIVQCLLSFVCCLLAIVHLPKHFHYSLSKFQIQIETWYTNKPQSLFYAAFCNVFCLAETTHIGQRKRATTSQLTNLLCPVMTEQQLVQSLYWNEMKRICKFPFSKRQNVKFFSYR